MRRFLTILLVDDDETTNFLHHRLLNRLDAAGQVLVATNGQQALKILAHPASKYGPANPVLVLLDLNMPVTNGFEFLVAFQALPRARQQGAVVGHPHLLPEPPGPGPGQHPAHCRLPG